MYLLFFCTFLIYDFQTLCIENTSISENILFMKLLTTIIKTIFQRDKVT